MTKPIGPVFIYDTQSAGWWRLVDGGRVPLQPGDEPLQWGYPPAWKVWQATDDGGWRRA